MDIGELRSIFSDKRFQAFSHLYVEDYLVSCPRGENPIFLPLTPVIKPQEITWHYTRPDAAQSIRETGVLRAMHYKTLADNKEVQYGINLIRQAYGEVDTGQYSLDARKWVKKLVNSSIDRLFAFPLYILCASLSSDVQYLWDNYAREGGSALGVPVSEQSRLAVYDSTRVAQNQQFNFANWRAIEYRENKQALLAQGVVKYLFQCYPDPQAAAFGLLYFVPFVKAHEYRNEEEVRFAVMRTDSTITTAEHTLGNGKRYLELNFGGQNSFDSITNPEGIPASSRQVHKVMYTSFALPDSSTWKTRD